MSQPESETAAIDPKEVARSVASTPDDQLAQGMSGEMRPVILSEIFRRMEEHFEPGKAQGVDAVIRFEIGGGPNGQVDSYEATIRDGACRVSQELVDNPRVTITTGGVEFLKLVTGNASGPELFMTGKLRIQGDLMFAASVTSLFRVPATE